MQVRGAPLIGAAAAYGLALGLDEDPTDIGLERAHRALIETRPTAVNLRWALGRVVDAVCALLPEARAERAFAEADAIAEEDVAINAALGALRRRADHGDRREEAGRDGQHPHPLQCRLARHRRLGHRHRADLSGHSRPASRSMSGSTRPARATRAPSSPPGS